MSDASPKGAFFSIVYGVNRGAAQMYGMWYLQLAICTT
jgi:hypothetical protein